MIVKALSESPCRKYRGIKMLQYPPVYSKIKNRKNESIIITIGGTDKNNDEE